MFGATGPAMLSQERPARRIAAVEVAKSPEVLQEGSRALAKVLPDAELRESEGLSHNVKVRVLVPALVEFFAEVPTSAKADGATCKA
jgi:hypothetical protein